MGHRYSVCHTVAKWLVHWLLARNKESEGLLALVLMPEVCGMKRPHAHSNIVTCCRLNATIPAKISWDT